MGIERPQIVIVPGVTGSGLTAPGAAGVPLVPAADGAHGSVLTLGGVTHPAGLPPLTVATARAARQYHTMPTGTPWALPFAQKMTAVKQAADCMGAQLDLIAALLCRLEGTTGRTPTRGIAWAPPLNLHEDPQLAAAPSLPN